MSHTISKEDFKLVEYKQQIAGSFGTGIDKSLEMHTTPGRPSDFVVVVGHAIVHLSKDFDAAIEAYNRY